MEENNFDKVMKYIDEAEKIFDKVDESFQRMSRGNIINTSFGTTSLVTNLRKANKIFKKVEKLNKEAGDSYTEEQAQIILAKAQELTSRYEMYYKLIDQANEIAKSYMKEYGKATVDVARDTIKETFGGIFHRHKKNGIDDSTENVSESDNDDKGDSNGAN